MAQGLHKLKKPEDLQKLPIIGKQPRNEKEEKFLRELIDVEFVNLEETGLNHKFSYGNAKNNHTFVLFHGGEYIVPRFIARHIESCATPLWDYRPNGTGAMEKKYIGTKSRFQMRQIFK